MEQDNPINKRKSKFIEQFIKPNLPKNKKEWVWFIIIILVVITLGTFLVNQYLGISYKATLIQSPCALCESFQNKILTGDLGLSLNLTNITFTTP